MKTRLFFRLAIVLALALVATPGSASDWPQLLGPDRDGRSPDAVAVLADGRTPVLWRVELGSGYAGPAIEGGTLVVFHRRGELALVEALDAASGRSLWSFSSPTDFRDDFGTGDGPRATPTIAGGRVFTFGAEGRLQALRLADGEPLWSVDTRRAFGAEKGFFGVATSPLAIGERLIVNVGGPDGAGVVAFEAATGKVAWRTSDDGASYASPIAARLGETTRVLVWTRERPLALDPATGTIEASFPWRSRSRASVNAATPLLIGEKVFLSAVYGTGAVLLKAWADGFEPLWSERDALSNHYATSVHHDGVLFGFHGAIHEGGAVLRAVQLGDGRLLWERPDVRSGFVLLARDDLVIVTEGGELVIAPASGAGFDPKLRTKILDGGVRAAPALALGRLYARDDRGLVAVELRPP